MINALNKRHGQAAAVHHPHPHRIAGAFASSPWGGAAVVNPVGKRLKGSGVQQALNIGFQLARVGDVSIAQAKGQLGGFNNAVKGVGVVGLRHVQPVGNAEDCQRDQPLGRWGEVKHLPLLMLQRQRRGAPGSVGV